MNSFCKILIGRTSFFLAIAILGGWSSRSANGQAMHEGMVEVPYKDKNYVGRPLAWDGKDLMLLRRDGRISRLPVTKISSLQLVSKQYKPFAVDELRANLNREFGSKYQVSVTNDFVVVHPHGSQRKWAQPFQELYHRFRIFFESRGIKLKRPQAKMVAVVLRTRNEYDRFIRDYHSTLNNTVGYYNPASNRIITYDQSSEGRDWLESNETIIHEATHQTAYNTGIHRRYGNPPKWVTEGLAQLFEAKGINNSRFYSRQSDRINKQCLRHLQTYYRQGKVAGQIENLVLNDNLFRADASRAYTISWGLAFFLAESYPKKYAAYLAHDASREAFKRHTRTDRANDFAEFFGSNFENLEARMKTFYSQL
jgi:hypothetical protein